MNSDTFQGTAQDNIQDTAQTSIQENSMTLKVLLPTKVLVECQVSKVIAEAQNGSFCLLPKHIDFVTALVPGILTFIQADNNAEDSKEKTEQYVAVDVGILVKCGREVLVSVYNAVSGQDLDQLNDLVGQHFIHLDEQQRIARSALARLEIGVMRHFIELEDHRHG